MKTIERFIVTEGTNFVGIFATLDEALNGFRRHYGGTDRQKNHFFADMDNHKAGHWYIRFDRKPFFYGEIQSVKIGLTADEIENLRNDLFEDNIPT